MFSGRGFGAWTHNQLFSLKFGEVEPKKGASVKAVDLCRLASAAGFGEKGRATETFAA
jgi:hypothetical protein